MYKYTCKLHIITTYLPFIFTTHIRIASRNQLCFTERYDTNINTNTKRDILRYQIQIEVKKKCSVNNDIYNTKIKRPCKIKPILFIMER